MPNNIPAMPTQNPWAWALVGMGMGVGTQYQALIHTYDVVIVSAYVHEHIDYDQ